MFTSNGSVHLSTGISCTDQQSNTVIVQVDKCTDPLEVNITVRDEQTILLQSTVTNASDLVDNNYAIDTFTRDSQTLTISVRAK